MPRAITGIHHVTAIASDPQTNVNFYVGVLGLRLVKRTVNFDDPGTYHLYYGDDTGQPGTLITFFPYPRAHQGQRGTQQITATAFAIPPDSVGYWLERLRAHNIQHEAPKPRFDHQIITVFDPDGLVLELVAGQTTGNGPFHQAGPVPHEHALRGVHNVTMAVSDLALSTHFLRDVMRFAPVTRDGEHYRFHIDGNGPGQYIDLVHMPNVDPGRVAAGTVHHIAYRAPAERDQTLWRVRVHDAGRYVTTPQDRRYFQSIYFREPGGVLFEIATDEPGFTHDEDAATLGTRLMLPPWLEDRREQLEQRLPELTIPAV